MKRRRRSKDPLPRAPLELAYPLGVRAAGPEGGAVLREVPAAHALMVLKTLRLVLAWCQGPDAAGGLLRRPEMDAWEEEVLLSRFEEALWAPVATLAAELRRPERADPRTVSNACFAVSEWALGARAEETALLFAEAAALAWPENARWAWIAGRLFRNLGRFREGELWLKRAIRVAVWNDDWETQDLALNSLGNLYMQRGQYARSLHHLQRALSIASRYVGTEREGAVKHDLLMLSINEGRFTDAEKHALRTFDRYGTTHPNLPRLAHDLGIMWSRQRRFETALPVFDALLDRFTAPLERVRVLAATARAAGGCQEAGKFEAAWTEGWEIVRMPDPELRVARSAVLIDLAIGATGLGHWEHASSALTEALSAAKELDLRDDAETAETALAQVERRVQIERPAVSRVTGVTRSLADMLAKTLHIET